MVLEGIFISMCGNASRLEFYICFIEELRTDIRNKERDRDRPVDLVDPGFPLDHR